MINFITEHWIVSSIIAYLVIAIPFTLFAARLAGFNNLGHDEE